MNKETMKELAIDGAKIAIKTVASVYILKHKIEDACIETACNMVNKYVFKDEEPMFK